MPTSPPLDQPAARAGPACRRCGSHSLRRPHSRNGWERFLRRSTRWDRYACLACGTRGWVRERVAAGSGPEAPLGSPPRPVAVRGGRPIEHRDLRARRAAAVRGGLAVAFALAAGAITALLLGRCGGTGAPP